MTVGIDASALLLLAFAVSLGAFVQAATGFGFALIAAPMFLAALNSTAAIQVLVALHVVQSVMVVPKLANLAPRLILAPLMIGSLIGFPLGLVLFLRLDVSTLKLSVGVLVLAFSALLIARDAGLLERRGGLAAPPAETGRRLLPVVVGAASGFLTSVLVMPGPPLILYLLGRDTRKDASRALSLTFFAFCYVMVTAMHALFGGMGGREWLLVALLAPAVPLATLAGTALARRLSEGAFRALVLTTLVLSGAYAVWSSL